MKFTMNIGRVMVSPTPQLSSGKIIPSPHVERSGRAVVVGVSKHSDLKVNDVVLIKPWVHGFEFNVNGRPVRVIPESDVLGVVV